MTQTGVVHIEFHWPEKTGTLIYDSKQTSVEKVVAQVKEGSKRELSIVRDGLFP